MDVRTQDQIADLVAHGTHLTLDEIARNHGLSLSQLRRVAHKAGRAYRNDTRTPARIARDERIVRLLNKGLSYRDIGQHVGLSYARIEQIAVQYGIISQYDNRADPAALECGKQWFLRGMPIAHAAESVGLPDSTLYAFLVREGLHKPTNDDKPWEKAEEDFLRQNYCQGRLSAADIGDELGRTRNEVIGKAHRMGLGSGRRRRK